MECPHRPPCPGCPRYGEPGIAPAARAALAALARAHGLPEVPVVSGATSGLETSFEPDRLPSPDEIVQLVKSQEYQKRKPRAWEEVEPIDKDFYQTWFERHPENEPFDFDKIFMSHSANHANFLDPKFFVNLNGATAPYSVADSLRVCSSCLEFFNILGGQWKIKYVTPCIGAVMFARLPADRYLEVNTDAS